MTAGRYNWLKKSLEKEFPNATVLMTLRDYKSMMAIGLFFNVPPEEAFGRIHGDVETQVRLPVKKRMLPQIIEALS